MDSIRRLKKLYSRGKLLIDIDGILNFKDYLERAKILEALQKVSDVEH